MFLESKVSYLLNTTTDVLSLYHNLEGNCSNVVDSELLIRGKSSVEESSQIIPHIDVSTEFDLFEYYVVEVSKKKVFNDEQLNEFRSIIVPKSIISPSLFQSIIAIAASDLIRKDPTNHKYYKSLTDRYKNEAINMMFSLLDNPSEEHINEILITILILCSLEIGENGNDNWINYLKQSCLIFQSLDRNDIMESNVLLFCYRYFALRYILLLTTLNTTEYFKLTNTFPLKLVHDYFVREDIDYMLGCSPKLLKVINDIAAVRNMSPSNSQLQKIIDVQNTLESIMESEVTEKLSHFANLYLHATKLYFHNCCKKFLPTGEILFDVNESRIKLVFTITELSSTNISGLFPGWTLLILGVSDIDEHVRIEILKHFADVELRWPKSSGNIIRNALEIIWKITDLNPEIDWQEILSTVNFKLALT